MKLANYLAEEDIFIIDSVPDTTAFYHEFSHFLKSKGIVNDAKAVKRLFLKRESLHSTGVGQGAATPHIFSKEFDRFHIFAALVRNGVDFKAPDNLPVHLTFLIVSDDRDVGLHLKSLAHISRLVLNTGIVEKARMAESPEALYKLLIEIEKTI